MTPDVTVLGAGIVGVCTALSLAERGIAVRVIDRDAPGQETSYGNAGVISPWSVIPQSMPGLWRNIPGLMFGRHRALSVKLSAGPGMLGWGLRFLRNGTEDRVRATADAMEYLCAPSVELFRRHLQGTGDEGIVADSWYVHAFRDASRAGLTSLDYRIRREKGAELEVIGADELKRLEPALSPDFKAAVLIKGQARALAPGRLAQVLAVKAKGLGADFLRTEIRGLRQDGSGWRIDCADGAYSSPKVVIALGAWSAALLADLGIRLPLMAERGYHVEFSDPGVVLQNSVMDVDAKVVASSMEGGLRLAGQAEFAAVDAPPDPGAYTRLTRIAKAALPGLRTEPARTWMGRRPSFPDSLPALGELKNRPGLICNFGHSHYGLMMAPKSGEQIADLVTSTPSNYDPAPFLPGRF